jgi:hypothetical protein
VDPMICFSAGKEGLEQPTKPITEAGLCFAAGAGRFQGTEASGTRSVLSRLVPRDLEFAPACR